MGRKKRKRQQNQSQNDTAVTTTATATATATAEDGGNEIEKKHQKKRSLEKQQNDASDATSNKLSLLNSNKIGNCYDQLIQFGLDECKPLNWLDTIYSISPSFSTLLLRHSDEIKYLTNELNTIKHALWPAAIKTCKAKNRFRKTGKRKNSKGTISPSLEFSHAREKCNPFEKLGTQKWLKCNTDVTANVTTTATTTATTTSMCTDKADHSNKKSFVCRSAMKLANIDAMLDFKLTTKSTTITKGDTKSDSPSSFKFVDLCGAPGGFSEYILRKMTTGEENRNCYGYGMSLTGKNDDGCGRKWDLKTLSDLVTTKNNNDHDGVDKNWKVCHGQDGTGDIYNWDNVKMLQDEIWNDASPHFEEKSKDDNDEWKVDLVVADGGFDAQRDSECQESVAHQIVTCQTAASLFVLKKGGNFVIKMFGFQNSKRIMLHLRCVFEKLMILKPVTSRPASAERYVVCLNYSGLDSSFDLLSWRDLVIEDSFLIMTGPNLHVDNYLDMIDCNMLRLNIEACSEILSFLHEEEQLAKSGHNTKNENTSAEINFSYYQKHFEIGF